MLKRVFRKVSRILSVLEPFLTQIFVRV